MGNRFIRTVIYIGCFLLFLAQTAQALAGATSAPYLPMSSPLQTYRPVVPSVFASGWADTTWSPQTGKISLINDLRAPYGSIGLTDRQVFNLYSTALSAPGNTYFVNALTGSDGANCTSSATPCKSIYIAQGKCNTGGVPCLIYVAAITTWHTGYNRSVGFNAGSSFPTVDTAYVCTGGRCNVGTYDEYSNPTQDATYANCYSWSQANNDEVLDTLNLNRIGNYNEFANDATPALANGDAGGGKNAWAQSGSTIYVCRGDHAPVTFKNSRVLRSTVSNFVLKNQVNIYIGGQTANDGWDLEGGDLQGVISTEYTSTTLPTNFKTIVASNVSMKYDGGVVNSCATCNPSGSARGFAIDSIHGTAFCFNCRSDAHATDDYNLHHTLANLARSYMVIVNSSGADAGRGTSTTGQGSDNFETNHDDTEMMDVAGVGAGNRGGSLRSVLNAKAWFVGTVVQGDLSDGTMSTGNVPVPTAISTGQDSQTTQSTEFWVDGVKCDMPGGTLCMVANPGTTIHYKNMSPTRQPASAVGTGSIVPY